MSAPAWLLVIRWLIWDTFRQALASRIFWVMLGVSTLCIVFCLSVSFVDLDKKPLDERPERLPGSTADAEHARREGVDVINGEVRFLFGSVRVPWHQYRDDAVRWLQLVLAGGVADTLGLLLALIWTAAFLPTFLEPSSVTVLLAKPVPRWSLLAGKYIGVLVFVAFQAFIFVAGTWLALAIRSGVWDPHYLWCIPLLVLHFAIFFSFSCMLAVWTRSTVVCVFGSLLFWMLCWGMNYGRHAALAVPTGGEAGSTRVATQAAGAVGLAASSDPMRSTVAAAAAKTDEKSPTADTGKVGHGFSLALEVGYWVLPKPADIGLVLGKLLGAEDYLAPIQEFRTVEKRGWLHLEWSLLASCVFALAMLAVAGYEFVKADY